MATASIGSYGSSQTDTHGFKDGMKRVSEDASKLKDDVVGLGHDVAVAAKSGISAAKEEVTHKLEAAKEKGQEAADTITDFVSDRPLTSIGIAAGVGVLIGMLLCRPRI